jgi:hypothetical protein
MEPERIGASDRRTPVKCGIPVRFPSVPARRDNPETCDHDTAFFSHDCPWSKNALVIMTVQTFYFFSKMAVWTS